MSAPSLTRLFPPWPGLDQEAAREPIPQLHASTIEHKNATLKRQGSLRPCIARVATDMHVLCLHVQITRKDALSRNISKVGDRVCTDGHSANMHALAHTYTQIQPWEASAEYFR